MGDVCVHKRYYSHTPLFRGFWEEKFRPLKPRNRGDREIGRQLLFPLMTQATNLIGNRGHDTALLHYRTSQYAFIYEIRTKVQSSPHFTRPHSTRSPQLRGLLATDFSSQKFLVKREKRCFSSLRNIILTLNRQPVA